MIWSDTVTNIYNALLASSVYNAQTSTTPDNLCLLVLNQAKDWLCMYKPWRDLRVTVQLPLDAQRKVTLPTDCGAIQFVYVDPAGIGKPMYVYTLNANDVSRRYTEEVTYDSITGIQTRKIAFPPTVYIPQNPYVVYSKVVEDYTQADIDTATKKCFFPINIMLVVAKKIFQDYYGVPANQDPNWINARVAEELRMFEAYAYLNNMALEMSIKDQFGNPVFIQGMSMSGRRQGVNRPSPFLPATLFTGGTM